jgi:thioredoxin 1
MGNLVEFSDETFQQEVLESSLPVLVDFWAPWCGPCRMVTPVVEALAEDFSGRLKVGKINVDEAPDTAIKFQIMSIPTLMIFKGGTVVESIVGAQSREALTERIKPHLG